MNHTDPTMIYDRIAPDADHLLAAVARHGGRLALLRQLDAGTDTREMTARDIAVEEGIAHASVDDIAATFADAWASWYDDAYRTGDASEAASAWAQRVEAEHGERADEILADAGRLDEVRDR